MLEELTKNWNPAWVTALATLVGVAVALRIVVPWCKVRWMFRGNGAAIMALLRESSCQIMCQEGVFSAGRFSNRSRGVYVVVGEERYSLCRQDFDRLCEHGYIYRSGEFQGFELSAIGESLLDGYKNAQWLAKGIMRARSRGRYRCNGGRLLRCYCEKQAYRVLGREIPLPFYFRWK